MSLYPYSIAFIRKKIEDDFGGAEIYEARESDLSQVKLDQVNIHGPSRIDIIEHILWMLEQVEQMPTDGSKSGKAGRWMGWTYAYLEVIGFTTSEDSRNMARTDSENGNT